MLTVFGSTALDTIRTPDKVLKGVLGGAATFAGISLGFSWHVLAPFAIVWLLTAFMSRYSSLAALLGSLAASFSLYFVGETNLFTCLQH